MPETELLDKSVATAPRGNGVVPSVVCPTCGNSYYGSDVAGRYRCKCGTNLLVKGVYLSGACPYAVDCPIPYGLCHCGCGAHTDTYRPHGSGPVGAKTRFVLQHNSRKIEFLPLKHNSGNVGPAVVTNEPEPKPTKSMNAIIREHMQANPGKPVPRRFFTDTHKITQKQMSTAVNWLKHNMPGLTMDRYDLVYNPVQAPAKQSPAQRDGLYAHRPDGPGVREAGEAVGVSSEALALYQVMEQVADERGRVTLSVWDAVKFVGAERHFERNGLQASGVAKRALRELHEKGCVDATNNRIKYMLQHPNGTLFMPDETVESRPIGQLIAAPMLAEAQPVDAVERIDQAKIAESVAKLMWERYEWAITEIGRLSELVGLQKTQIDRLEAALAEQPVTVSTIARRMMTDVTR